MKTSVTYNPFEGNITIVIRGLCVTDDDYFKIAEIAETTVKQNIETYFKMKRVIGDVKRLGKEGDNE